MTGILPEGSKREVEAKGEEMHEKEGEVKIMAELRTDGQMSACSSSVLDEVKGWIR